MENRRTQYTKKAIRESLLELLLEKPIEKISVTELCKKADINRSTFYTHYLDVFDLLQKIEDELYEEMNYLLFGQPDPDDQRPYMLRVIHSIYEHKGLYEVLLGKYGDHEFLYKLFTIGWTDEPHSFEEQCERRYLAAGSSSLLQFWFLQGQDKTPEEFAALLTKLNESVSRVLREK